MVIAIVANSPRTGAEHSGSRVLGQLVPNQLLLRTAMLGCFVGWTLRYLFFHFSHALLDAGAAMIDLHDLPTVNFHACRTLTDDGLGRSPEVIRSITLMRSASTLNMVLIESSHKCAKSSICRK